MDIASKLIYLVRHGETDLNKQGIVQGRGVDASLNEEGIAQSRAFFNAYKEIPFDKIYISTLKRTEETVQPFIDLGIPYQKLSGLDEVSWGSLEGLVNTPEIVTQFKTLSNQWEAGNYNAKAPNGESPAEVVIRLKDALSIILKQVNEKTILICMHGRAMRMLLCLLMHKPLMQMTDFPHQNTSLYKIALLNGNYTILDFNDRKHIISE